MKFSNLLNLKFNNYDANDTILFFILRKDLNQSDNLYKVAISYDRVDNKIIKTTIFNALDGEIDNLGTINSGKILDLTKQIALKVSKSDLAKLADKALNDKLSEEEFDTLFKKDIFQITKKLCLNPFLNNKQFADLLKKENPSDSYFYFYSLALNKFLNAWMQKTLLNTAIKQRDDLLLELLAKNETLDITIYRELLYMVSIHSNGMETGIYENLRNNNNPELQKLLQEEGFD